MDQMILTAGAVVDAFISAEADAAVSKEFNKTKKETADNAVSAFKKFITQEQGEKPAFMLPDTLAKVVARIETGFLEKGIAQPGAYRTVKNAITAYVREGFTDLSIGRDAMKKAAKAAEEARLFGAEKARQQQVNAYLAEQEVLRLAKLEEEAAAAAAEKEAAAAAELAHVATLWRQLQKVCTSNAAKAAFDELVATLAINL